MPYEGEYSWGIVQQERYPPAPVHDTRSQLIWLSDLYMSNWQASRWSVNLWPLPPPNSREAVWKRPYDFTSGSLSGSVVTWWWLEFSFLVTCFWLATLILTQRTHCKFFFTICYNSNEGLRSQRLKVRILPGILKCGFWQRQWGATSRYLVCGGSPIVPPNGLHKDDSATPLTHDL